MIIYGQEYTREDLLRRNNLQALYGARRVTVAEGRGKGQGLVEIKTTDGLRATILEDKCLDILDLEYRGINLGFLSKNGLVNENLPETASFHQYWFGGFLSTCGIRNSGPPCTIDGEFFPFHGRIGVTAAEQISISIDDKLIAVEGTIRESALFGHCLEMRRRIEIPSDGASITIRDVISNLTPVPQPILMLYHINFGFPFLSEHLVAKFPEGEVRGRCKEAQAVVNSHNIFTEPKDGVPEHVFYHLPHAEYPRVLLSNNKLSLHATIDYKRCQFPILAEWRCMKPGDYALGIEPTTGYIVGRAESLANGYDTSVQAFSSLEFGCKISIFRGE